MSETWLGKHNPEWHEQGMVVPGWAHCLDCDAACMWDDLCKCCLLAEVEALTARAEKAEKAEKAVERVRKVERYYVDAWDEEAVPVAALKNALDGGDDE